GNGYQSSLMHLLEKRPALFISKIENDKCIIEIYQDLQIKRTIISSTRDFISHSIKRYVKLGLNIESGEDITNAIKNIARTHVANLMPNRLIEKSKLGIFSGIDNFYEWVWSQDDDVGYIYVRVLPGIEEWKKWSPAQVMKIIKNQNLDMLNSIFTAHTENNKL
ncbi:5746_t:CDS:2, partial [Dentiscutata heterogama]